LFVEEKIRTRLEELAKAERETELQLMAIRTVQAELRALLAPVMSGDPLGDEEAA